MIYLARVKQNGSWTYVVVTKSVKGSNVNIIGIFTSEKAARRCFVENKDSYISVDEIPAARYA